MDTLWLESKSLNVHYVQLQEHCSVVSISLKFEQQFATKLANKYKIVNIDRWWTRTTSITWLCTIYRFDACLQFLLYSLQTGNGPSQITWTILPWAPDTLLNTLHLWKIKAFYRSEPRILLSFTIQYKNVSLYIFML